MGRCIRLVFALCALALLAGCSGTRLAYNNADSVLRWMALDYFDLGDAQEEDLRARVTRFHAWHRAEELPRYGKLSQIAADKLAGGIARQDLIWAWDQVMARYRHMAGRAAPDLAAVLVTLTPEQLAHLERSFAESNRKFTKKFLGGSPDEQRLRRDRRNLEMLQDWYGDLSAAQEAQFRRASAELPLLYELRLKNRQRRQREFVELLRARRNGADLATGLQHWLRDWEAGANADYMRLSREYRARYMDLLIELDRSLSAAQRAHAVTRLREYAEIFLALAAQGETAVTVQQGGRGG